jgi:hypothetical protein
MRAGALSAGLLQDGQLGLGDREAALGRGALARVLRKPQILARRARLTLDRCAVQIGLGVASSARTVQRSRVTSAKPPATKIRSFTALPE